MNLSFKIAKDLKNSDVKMDGEKELLLFELDCGLINDEEFLLLYDLSRESRNLQFPYWQYPRFNLDSWTEDECWSDFRFHKEDMGRLRNCLFPNKQFIPTPNRLQIDCMEALALTLRRLAFPCRYSDLISKFGRSVPDLCHIFNACLQHLYESFGHLLKSFDQPWLSREKLQEYALKIHSKGAPLDNCWGFIDGTIRQVARPSINQKIMYSGHKRKHGYKMQSVSAPNGLIANLFGPIEGSRHDSFLLGQSGLMELLERGSFSPTGQPLCLYGDPAYPHRVHLQVGYRNPVLPEEKLFNESMSSCRVSVEWVFGDVVERFKFTNFGRMQKIGLSAVAKQFFISALLSNARTCLYGSTTSTYFNCDPPTLEEYLSG